MEKLNKLFILLDLDAASAKQQVSYFESSKKLFAELMKKMAKLQIGDLEQYELIKLLLDNIENQDITMQGVFDFFLKKINVEVYKHFKLENAIKELIDRVIVKDKNFEAYYGIENDFSMTILEKYFYKYLLQIHFQDQYKAQLIKDIQFTDK